ncbi:AfsR/SARP family transcriptional regulator [Saccharopolyspora shandongensis]|uniref:AfsR/SARP family transcriptional regulator n=1 Tax=Saccharopolyspora shandongensis TaxID=418495 RepID=UPI001FE4A74B|nr:AfsR/SARP family transcriptional regulator [Saccharopolyspora shandongensis]
MRVTVLGPVGACADDGTPIRVPGVRPRMLLARLALTAGESVPTGALIDDLWSGDPPTEAVNALHALVYRLRKALGNAVALESMGTGYRLAMPAENVDAHRFEEMATRGRQELAADLPREATASLGAALALWQGAALSDVRDAPFATRASARLEELRIGALEDRFDAELRLGHHAGILADLEALSAEHPLRERLAALRMRALHAAGRQADALAVHEELRRALADELGVDPSAEVREAHLAVLRGATNRQGTARIGTGPPTRAADRVRRPGRRVGAARRVGGNLPAGHGPRPRRGGQDTAGGGGGVPASGPPARPVVAGPARRGERTGQRGRRGARRAQFPGRQALRRPG